MANEPVTMVVPTPETRGPSEWIRIKNPEAWKVAGAAQAGKWDANWPQLTSQEFDAAIAAAADISIG